MRIAPLFSSGLRRLDAWFGREQRVLPWRSEPTLYRVWVSEIMLQQTQVITVLPYFERWIARFPDVETLARSTEEEVTEYWAGLGYYSRARNLRLAAQAIVAAGKFPTTREGWEAVKGVGPYTAGAILSIALDQPEPILDGNVERVFSRLRCVPREGAWEPAKRRLWRLARIGVTRANALGIRPSHFNQALMELGATVCTPRNPKCLLCPLQDLCRARQRGNPEAYPGKKKTPGPRRGERIHGLAGKCRRRGAAPEAPVRGMASGTVGLARGRTAARLPSSTAPDSAHPQCRHSPQDPEGNARDPAHRGRTSAGGCRLGRVLPRLGRRMAMGSPASFGRRFAAYRRGFEASDRGA